MPLILKDARRDEMVVIGANNQSINYSGTCGVSGRGGKKNAGLAMVTLNLHSQPRLPGSVVGEWSMR